MTDLSMLVYLKAKKDDVFKLEIREILEVPHDSDQVAMKVAFANVYAAWLIGKGKWQEFAKENEIEL